MMDRIFKFLAIAFFLGWLTKNLAAPAFGVAFYYRDFMDLSSQCATAMDSEWFSRDSERKAIDSSNRAMMLVCHDYDLTQKKMQSLGVTDEIISYLSLKSLELNQISSEGLTRQHRFIER